MGIEENPFHKLREHENPTHSYIRNMRTTPIILLFRSMKYKEWQYENKNGIQQNYLHDTQYCSYKMQPFLIIVLRI
jgi:hypothetical protein